MSAVEILDPGEPTLAELAEAANGTYHAAHTAMGSVIDNVVACGRTLRIAHDRLVGQGWYKWIDENLDFSRERAGKLIRLAAAFDAGAIPPEAFQQYRSKAGRLHQPSIGRALAFALALPPLFEPGGPERLPGEKKLEAKQLHKHGFTTSEIAKSLGVSRTWVVEVFDPEAKRRRRARRSQREKLARAAHRALQAQERRKARDNAAKAAGGSLNETYSLIRKALDDAQRAFDAASDSEIRAAVNETMTHLHNAEETISKATLKASLI